MVVGGTVITHRGTIYIKHITNVESIYIFIEVNLHITMEIYILKVSGRILVKGLASALLFVRDRPR